MCGGDGDGEGHMDSRTLVIGVRYLGSDFVGQGRV